MIQIELVAVIYEVLLELDSIFQERIGQKFINTWSLTWIDPETFIYKGLVLCWFAQVFRQEVGFIDFLLWDFIEVQLFAWLRTASTYLVG